MCWYKTQSFVYLKDESKKFCYSDNFKSLLWGYYSFGLWILLTLELAIRIITKGDMVVIKLKQGGSWKKFAKLIMWSLS